MDLKYYRDNKIKVKLSKKYYKNYIEGFLGFSNPLWYKTESTARNLNLYFNCEENTGFDDIIMYIKALGGKLDADKLFVKYENELFEKIKQCEDTKQLLEEGVIVNEPLYLELKEFLEAFSHKINCNCCEKCLFDKTALETEYDDIETGEYQCKHSICDLLCDLRCAVDE